jgi:peptidoglycan hydrolase CwlO-like protein
VTEPPLISVSDVARQSTLEQVQAALTDLAAKVDQLMSEDSTVAAEAAAIETDVTNLTTAVTALQSLISSLQAEVTAGALSPATMDALAKAEADLGTITSTAQADVTADTPPAT